MSSPRPPPRKQLTARGQRTRQELLDAAEQVFGERGYERASVADITRAAGVALGTFYVYFPHKQAIFTELVEELSSRLRAALAEAVRGKTSRLERERAGFKAFFDFAAQHHHLYRIVRQAEFVDEAIYQRYYRTLAQAYARGLKRAMGRGEIARYRPEVLAYALMGIADFLGMRFVVWEGKGGARGLTEEILHFIEHGLLSPARLSPPRSKP